jgi:hypothetical protein
MRCAFDEGGGGFCEHGCGTPASTVNGRVALASGPKTSPLSKSGNRQIAENPARLAKAGTSDRENTMAFGCISDAFKARRRRRSENTHDVAVTVASANFLGTVAVIISHQTAANDEPPPKPPTAANDNESLGKPPTAANDNESLGKPPTLVRRVLTLQPNKSAGIRSQDYALSSCCVPPVAASAGMEYGGRLRPLSTSNFSKNRWQKTHPGGTGDRQRPVARYR